MLAIVETKKGKISTHYIQRWHTNTHPKTGAEIDFLKSLKSDKMYT